MNLTTFSPSEYLAGQPVYTRDGRAVPMLKEFPVAGISTMFYSSVIDGLPVLWNSLGQHDLTGATQSPLDLFMGELIVYKWAPTASIIDTDPNDDSFTKIIIAVTPAS